LNLEHEYTENWKTFRIIPKTYYKPNDQLSSFIKTKNYLNNFKNNWLLLQYEKNYLLTNDYIKEEKLYLTDLKSKFIKKINSSKNYFEENWIYYFYNYKESYSFENMGNWIYLSDLKRNKINFEKDLLVEDNKSFYFVKDFEKTRLIKKSILLKVKEKETFLKYLKDDIKKYNSWLKNYDLIFKKLNQLSLSITKKGKNEIDKQELLFNWVVNNIKYKLKSWKENYNIFSGIETYKNKYWVCDWYSKLYIYMLLFNWYTDIEQISWHVLDSKDFWKIWHAWVRIWNYYYDPTFENPKTEKLQKNLYYRLPQEILNANRIELDEIPDNLLKMTLKERKNKIENEYYNLLKKYNFKKYNILSFYAIKKKITNWVIKDLTLKDLKKYYWEYKLNWNYLIDNKGHKKMISQYDYYIIKDSPEYLNILISTIGFKKAKVLYSDNAYKLIYNIK